MRTRALAVVAGLAVACAARAEEAPLDPGARTPEAVPGAAVSLAPVASFSVGSGGGYAIDVARDGTIGVGGRNGDLVLVAPDGTRRSVHPYSNAVESFAFSPDGARAVSGALDGGILVWDLKTLTTVWRSPGGAAATWSPDGKTLAHTLPDAEHVRLIDAATFDTQTTLAIDAEDRRVERIRFAPDSKTVALGTQEGTVVVFDVATGKRLSRVVVEADEPIYALAILGDGRIAAASRQGAVRIGDATFRLPGGASALAVAPDGSRIVIGGNREGALTSIDLKSLDRTVLVEKGKARWVGALAFSRDGALHWVSDGGPLSTLRDGKTTAVSVGADEIRNLAWSPDGAHLAASSNTGAAFAHLADGSSTPSWFEQPQFGNGGSAWSVVASGRRGAEFALLRGAELVLLDGASGRETAVEKITPDPYPILQGAWGAPDGSAVVAGVDHMNTTVVLLPEGRALEAPFGFLHPLDVAWSPDGKQIALALVGGHHGEFQQAVLGTYEAGRIDVAKGELVGRVTWRDEDDGAGAPVSVAFSPSGKRLVVSESVGTFEVVPGSREVVRRTKAALYWLRFLDEDTALASSGKDLGVWDTKSDTVSPVLLHPDLRAWALSPDRSAIAVATRFRVFVYRISRKR